MLALALGIFLALLGLGAGYFHGKEPACTASDFVGSQPGAVEYRDGKDAWGKTCSAIAADGRVIAVQHYPSRGDWIAAAVLLLAPLTLRAGRRRLRR